MFGGITPSTEVVGVVVDFLTSNEAFGIAVLIPTLPVSVITTSVPAVLAVVPSDKVPNSTRVLTGLFTQASFVVSTVDAANPDFGTVFKTPSAPTTTTFAAVASVTNPSNFTGSAVVFTCNAFVGAIVPIPMLSWAAPAKGGLPHTIELLAPTLDSAPMAVP